MTAEHRIIATLRTPPGRGGIAVIAVSGDGAEDLLAETFRPLRSGRPGKGKLQFGHVVSGNRLLDEALVCRTDDSVELQVHGGPQVLRSMLELLAAKGAEIVPPEEAGIADLPIVHPRWENPAIGREMLDLLPQARGRLAAEALAAQWSGGISALARETPAAPDALLRAADGLTAMRRLLNAAEVVLAGPPNAGKSALANAIVGRPVSIVHQTPGTTRDWVRAEAIIDGVPIWLTDTAGIWRPGGAACGERSRTEDAEAVRRARERLSRADLILLVRPGRADPPPAWCPRDRTLLVSSKSDAEAPCPEAEVAVSAKTGDGLDALRQAMVTKLGLSDFDPAKPRAFTQRQARLLGRAAEAAGRTNTGELNASLEELLTGPVSPTDRQARATSPRA